MATIASIPQLDANTKASIEQAMAVWVELEEESKEPFPVNFELIRVWSGYSQKGIAKRKLMGKTSTLCKGRDYIFALPIGKAKGSGGANKQDIKLTISAAKQFMLQARAARR